jgi:hypothetical protein
MFFGGNRGRRRRRRRNDEMKKKKSSDGPHPHLGQKKMFLGFLIEFEASLDLLKKQF